MKIGIVLQSNRPEHIWNTFRFGITSLKANHQVTIFLMNEGAELDAIPDTEDFDISKKVADYKELKGDLYACGTCLELRGKRETGVCPVSTMADLPTVCLLPLCQSPTDHNWHCHVTGFPLFRQLPLLIVELPASEIPVL